MKVACSVPIDIVKTAYEGIKLQEELAVKGSKLALSDVGCGAALLRSALVGGWLNVKINIGMIKDQTYVEQVKAELKPLIAEGTKLCDEIYASVEANL